MSTYQITSLVMRDLREFEPRHRLREVQVRRGERSNRTPPPVPRFQQSRQQSGLRAAFRLLHVIGLCR